LEQLGWCAVSEDGLSRLLSSSSTAPRWSMVRMLRSVPPGEQTRKRSLVLVSSLIAEARRGEARRVGVADVDRADGEVSSPGPVQRPESPGVLAGVGGRGVRVPWPPGIRGWLPRAASRSSRTGVPQDQAGRPRPGGGSPGELPSGMRRSGLVPGRSTATPTGRVNSSTSCCSTALRGCHCRHRLGPGGGCCQCRRRRGRTPRTGWDRKYLTQPPTTAR
jgi:hypothetical protein